MRIAITGGTGLVGTRLTARLESSGHQVHRITRRPSLEHDIEWDPAQERLDRSKLDGCDAIIHLAGDNIATSRWTKSKKSRIYESRVGSTRFLVSEIAKCSNRPKHFLSASAIGYYGHRGDDWMTESSEQGEGFLSDTCAEWEEAARSVSELGLRLVIGRIGVVVANDGGILKQMRRVLRTRLGGRAGNGRQFISWIGIDDLANAFQFLVESDATGVFNLVANATTNSEFTNTVAKQLGCPAWIPLPSFAVHLLFGEMGFELFLASTRVFSERLTDAGFEFQHKELAGLLESLEAQND